VREKRSQQHATPAPSTYKIAEEKGPFLAQSKIFQGLSTEEINALEHIATMTTCQNGRVLYRPGEKGTSLFLLKTGRIQLYHLSSDGRKLIIAIIEAGDSFGETLLLGEGRYDCFAEAVADSRLCVINKNDVQQLLSQKPAIALAFLNNAGQRLLQLEAQLIDTSFKSTAARLATLLLVLARTRQHYDEPLTIDGLSHEELAERLGVYRETVSGALRELKEAGAIELGRKHIIIHEPAQLELLAITGGRVEK
jgi:CRP/FNR family transcriptional regulator, cyclic AMP receptor protein